MDGGSIMLEVSRLKDTRARSELIGAAREYAPNLNLTTPSFLVLVDLFRVCLREGNNSSDFRCVRNVFNVVYQYAMDQGGGIFYVGRLLQSHEAWRNIKFWLFCAEELIRYDILRFTYWMQRSQSSPILPLEEPFFVATVVIIRLQAIVFNSMQVVRVPAEVMLEFINTAADTYGLSSEKSGGRVDILRRPVSDFLAWLQDTVVYEMRADLAQFIAEENSQAVSRDIGSCDNIKRNSSKSVSKASDLGSVEERQTSGIFSYDLGFCPLLELLYRLVVKRANTSPAMTTEPMKFASINGHASNVFGGSMISCVCGHPTGQWRVLGAFSESKTVSSTLSRRMIRHVLCETCFRRLCQTEAAPAPVQNIVPMGSCAVPLNWPGNLPNNFIAVFYGSGLNEYKAGVASNISIDNLRAFYSRYIQNTLLDRSESGPQRIMSSSTVLKLIASEGRELTSIGISGSSVPRAMSVSSADVSVQGANSGSSRHSSQRDRDQNPVNSASVQRQQSDRPGQGRVSKVHLAKDSLHVQRDRLMRDSQLQVFISAMQSGVDILKFGHNIIYPLQLRTFFLDKDVTRLCWLPPGK